MILYFVDTRLHNAPACAPQMFLAASYCVLDFDEHLSEH